MAADGKGEEASSFRCIDAARYAVASVVTILMVVVVVRAKMVLRPKSLYLSVPGGSLFVRRLAWPRREVLLDFTIRAQNPSRRVSLYYVSITGYIFDNTIISAESSSNPKNDSIAFFILKDDMSLPQNAEQFSSITVRLLQRQNAKASSYFDMLYVGEGRNIISDVTLRLDGWLLTQPSSISFNRSALGGFRTTSFYCRPLLIGGNHGVDAFINKQEAFCVSGSGKTSGAN